MKKLTKTSLTQKAMQALSDAVAKVVEDHQRRGRPLAIWRDGKAVWISVTGAAAVRESPTPYRTEKKKDRRLKAKDQRHERETTGFETEDEGAGKKG